MSLGLQLAVLVARGLMSLEDLDVATPASRELERDRMRSGDGHHGPSGWPGRRSPAGSLAEVEEEEGLVVPRGAAVAPLLPPLLRRRRRRKQRRERQWQREQWAES